MSRPSRTETEALEPNYLRELERDREGWWKSSNYDTWKNLYISEYARGHYILDTLAHFVPGFRPEGRLMLDVGCGDGGVPIAFAERGAEAAGIEPGERNVERARVRARDHDVRVRFDVGVAEDLPWDDASVDVVVLDNVLEHVTDQERTLAEIRRVLRPQGLLYVVTPKPFALLHLWSDPHYELAGLVLLPRALQKWYFERVRGGGEGAYNVGTIPTRRRLLRLVRAAGFATLAGPAELWIHYLRDRLARPDEIRGEAKRRLAARLHRARWPWVNPVSRAFFDVALGSNFVIARAE